MKNRTIQVIREYAESIAIALVLALIIRAFIVQAFKIPTGSMEPTLIVGDKIFVNKFIYRFKPIERGDIIVFKSPEDKKKDFIKRLIGKPQETLQIIDGKILINGSPINSGIIGKNYYYNRGDFGQEGQVITIPQDCYYALGDNSASSRDSRYWGFVPKKSIIGKAFIIYWPPQRIRLIK